MSLKPICVDDFGTLWYQASKEGFVDRRFACQYRGEWWQSAKFSYDGFVLQAFKDGSLDGSIKVWGWFQTCIIETYIRWGLVTREEVEQLGFKPRWS